jgi:hypothetical protein
VRGWGEAPKRKPGRPCGSPGFPFLICDTYGTRRECQSCDSDGWILGACASGVLSTPVSSDRGGEKNFLIHGGQGREEELRRSRYRRRMDEEIAKTRRFGASAYLKNEPVRITLMPSGSDLWWGCAVRLATGFGRSPGDLADR